MTLPHSDGWIGHWSPGIGDPTIVGWITVAFYFFGAWSCYRLATTTSVALRQRERAMWSALMVGLLALGINKQLDLQTAVTEIGRMMAIQQGWYAGRHEVQKQFVYGVAALVGLTAIAGTYLSREMPPATICALLGGVLLLGFIVVRAASFHHVDSFIRRELLGLSMNGSIEMMGIWIIIVSSFWRARRA